MSAKSAVLDIVVNASATGLDAFDDAGKGARSMASDFESAASSADDAAGRFDAVAGSAENLDDKAGRATGAMGALSSGFALVGADQAAAALEGAAMATDFLSGASQALTLLMDLESVSKVANAASTVAMTAVTKTAAAGQWLLNAALSANPIGLIVIAVAAFVAGLVLAYNKSETFRNIVDAAMSKVKVAIDVVSDAVGVVVEWFQDKAAPAVGVLKDKATAAFGIVSDKVDDVSDTVGDLVDWFREKVPAAVDVLKDRATAAFDFAFAPIKTAIGWVGDLKDAIAGIDFPSPPDWLLDLPGVPGGNGRVAITPTTSDADALFAERNGRGATGGGNTYVTVEVKQAIGDPVEAARQIRAILARADRITA